MLRGGISLPLRDSIRGTFGRIDGLEASIHGISMPLHNLLHAKFFIFFTGFILIGRALYASLRSLMDQRRSLDEPAEL